MRRPRPCTQKGALANRKKHAMRHTTFMALLLIVGPITAFTFLFLATRYARRTQRRETIKRRLETK